MSQHRVKSEIVVVNGEETDASVHEMHVDFEAVLRKCVTAIVKDDTDALLECVSSTPLPMQEALNILRQAWRRDKANQKQGAFMSDGGLVSAFFVGISELQTNAGLAQHEADNATTLMVSLIAEDDDADLLDVFMDWEPTFRVAGRGTKGDLDTTARFLVDSNAPNAAKRYLERRNDVVMAPRISFLKEHACHRLKAAARRVLEKIDAQGGGETEDSDLVSEFVKNILEGDGKVILHECDNGRIWSFGLALLDKDELMVRISDGKLADAKRSMKRAVSAAVCGDDFVSERLEDLSPLHPVGKWTRGLARITGGRPRSLRLVR